MEVATQVSCASHIDPSNTVLDLEFMTEALLCETDMFPNILDSHDFMRNQAQLATSKPYLMHEMLAVAGLRLYARTRERRELMGRALFHQSEALRLVQPVLESATEEHTLALLFFASYAALCGLAEPAFFDDPDDRSDPLEKMLHAFQLSRGIRALVSPHWSSLPQTWAWPVIQSQIEAGNDLVPQMDSVPGYAYVRCLVLGLEAETDRQACTKALEFTLGSISLLQQREDTSMCRRLVTSWAIETGSDFHTLLSERRPVSLVILAYYAVMLKIGFGLWWVGKWPEVLIRHIDATLPRGWAEFLEWPKSIVLNTAPGSASPTG